MFEDTVNQSIEESDVGCLGNRRSRDSAHQIEDSGAPTKHGRYTLARNTLENKEEKQRGTIWLGASAPIPAGKDLQTSLRQSNIQNTSIWP